MKVFIWRVTRKTIDKLYFNHLNKFHYHEAEVVNQPIFWWSRLWIEQQIAIDKKEYKVRVTGGGGGRQTGRQKDNQTDSQADRQADWQTAYRRAGRQSDRQTGRQVGKQASRQANWLIDWLTDRLPNVNAWFGRMDLALWSISCAAKELLLKGRVQYDWPTY
jgi:hypothetical protein